MRLRHVTPAMREVQVNWPSCLTLAVGERLVFDTVAARAAGTVEQRAALGREREAVPVAGLADALQLHRVVGMVEPAADTGREAARGEPMRVVVALDVPGRRVGAGQERARRPKQTERVRQLRR